MGRIFPTIRPNDVIRLSSVLVNVGSSALRRACGVGDFKRKVTGELPEENEAPEEEPSEEPEEAEVPFEEDDDELDPLDTPIEDLPVSVRLDRAFRRLDIMKVGDVLRHTPKDFLNLSNVGRETIKELKRFMTEQGVVWPHPTVAYLATIGVVWPNLLITNVLNESGRQELTSWYMVRPDGYDRVGSATKESAGR